MNRANYRFDSYDGYDAARPRIDFPQQDASGAALGWHYARILRHPNCCNRSMAEEITAHLSDPISEPELSRMWKSERTTFTSGSGDGIDAWQTAPELVLAQQGNSVPLSFPAGGLDQAHERTKAAFERAVHRSRPDVQIDWAA